MYPFFNCSSKKATSALSSCCVRGYILQSITSGVSSFSSIAWSHGLLGGNLCDASSLKTLACCRYFPSTSIFAIYCSACQAKSVEMELIVTSSDRISTIRCFASSVTVHPMCVPAMVGPRSTFVRWVDGQRISVYQSGYRITIGSMFMSTEVSFQENCGLNVASQG